ncbi:hypothetical protein KTO58_13640 [Chitinophaga pendula]|uniref:hypothetical protein n=1 Tax=Chitinophaga TaxID=79328 RepID=UPI000BB08AC0|nr:MULTISPECIES: hypothetical protein [Chitinophaga]ASZ12222.1 hypothetical protein CK934_15260 [Chitinophaga sp. MD30]UCJ04747.1 hypothetical protein KTO58_13640 [Chitinophaga pendula]
MRQANIDNPHKESKTTEKEQIIHTGSGGAFEETEYPTEEAYRELSDKQLDERLENTDTEQHKRTSKGKAY